MTETAFLAMVRSGELDRIQTALTAEPVLAQSTGPEGTSAVLLALYHGQREVAELLAAHKKETLSIFEAAALGRARDVAVLLHQDRTLAQALAPDGFTALHLAAFFGHYVCVKQLLEERANPNAVSQNSMRVTPLHSAVANTDATTAEALTAALLNAGADPNAQQADGFTPLQAALQNGQDRVERLLRAKGARA